MPTHKVECNFIRENEVIRRTVETTSPGEKNIDVSLTSAQTNKLYELTIDVSTLKSIYMDFSEDVTVEFNDSTTGAPTIAVKKGKPFFWHVDSGITNPFSADVTAVYFSTAFAGAVTGKVRILEDITA